MSGAAGATVRAVCTGAPRHVAGGTQRESTQSRRANVKLDERAPVVRKTRAYQFQPVCAAVVTVVAVTRTDRIWSLRSIGPYRKQCAYLMSAKGGTPTLPTPLPSGEDVNATHAEVFTGLSLDFSRINRR
jgi:hypothetical protein